MSYFNHHLPVAYVTWVTSVKIDLFFQFQSKFKIFEFLQFSIFQIENLNDYHNLKEAMYYLKTLQIENYFEKRCWIAVEYSSSSFVELNFHITKLFFFPD